MDSGEIVGEVDESGQHGGFEKTGDEKNGEGFGAGASEKLEGIERVEVFVKAPE